MYTCVVLEGGVAWLGEVWTILGCWPVRRDFFSVEEFWPGGAGVDCQNPRLSCCLDRSNICTLPSDEAMPDPRSWWLDQTTVLRRRGLVEFTGSLGSDFVAPSVEVFVPETCFQQPPEPWHRPGMRNNFTEFKGFTQIEHSRLNFGTLIRAFCELAS